MRDEPRLDWFRVVVSKNLDDEKASLGYRVLYIVVDEGFYVCGNTFNTPRWFKS